jgi:hypothetical protein
MVGIDKPACANAAFHETVERAILRAQLDRGTREIVQLSFAAEGLLPLPDLDTVPDAKVRAITERGFEGLLAPAEEPQEP